MKKLLFVAAMLAMACGGTDGPTDANGDPVDGVVCEAGRSVECACSSGEMGAQVCVDDGSEWGACKCAGSDSDVGAAGAEHGGSAAVERPVGYYASEVCEPYAGDDADKYCANMFGPILGTLYPAAYDNCQLPKGAVLAECVDLFGSACCWR